MTIHKPIFGTYLPENEGIQPGPAELAAFLESPKKEGGRERHAADLTSYTATLQAVEDFEQGRGAAPADLSERMLYGVLALPRCFTPAIKSVVELYKYHRHALASLDLRKPAVFIRSAEEEIGRLNPKRKDDAARINRLRELVESRKKDLEALRTRWSALVREMTGIAVYVRDNLIAVQKLCEASITVLAGLQVGRKEEARLIEDVKAHFKDQVRESLQQGPVTKEYLEQLKETVARLTKQLSLLLLEDVYAMTSLYEAIHEHARKAAGALDALLAEAAARKQGDLDADRDLFGRLEQVLVALVVTCRFEVKAREIALPDAEHGRLLQEKRREMLGHVFSLLPKAPR